MNREEAKLILQSYRPGGQDAGDPQFDEALALAKRDPELAAWFAEQQKFDAMVSSGLQKIAAPSQLKSQILARGQKSARPETFVEPPVANWWRNLFSFNSPVAWAAAILIFICLGIFWKKPGGHARFADFSARMVFAARNDTNHVDAKITDMKQVAAWLAERHGENKFVLPAALNGENGLMGCRVLDWRGEKVSMLCYVLKNSGHMDLFVVDAKIFTDAPPEDQPQFVTSGGMPTASWSNDGLAYLIVGYGNETDLEKVLQLKAAVAMRLSAGISL